MKLKAGLYIGIAMVFIIGGSLLAVKGKDAVSQAESRKQGILEAEQTTLFYQKSPGAIKEAGASAGDSVKEGEILFKVKLADEGDVEVLAPYDGLVDRVNVEKGDQVQAGVPLAVVQKNTYYTDLYIQESEIQQLEVNQSIDVHFPYSDQPTQVKGIVTSISSAPQFATLRMSREKGQADLSMFLVRISMDSNTDLLPGMTAEVKLDEITD
ncbi:HlyD family efflux transporter periplasmic adaptor subunit [Paenibacillus sp. ClWae2A]|uniref:HlyD family efflux transporter periplasmic adaptor subunit n=1 Tax=Paenibacillus sp. ClWae2A TaxID=3057177 RepID=UPI0028F50182|nr:HlyD family efflux transporter periplasmic adaptor subunit [Paenibacillus sp. ClWae2A]MDT9721960.1 HlyD family efflux transporter periplasmic adaptor subunit [Paenibacillus sp. ClWae2A]